jgi:hypothetical protein
VTTPTPRWEQAFSEDGGKTWETNWVMEMIRNDAMGSREYPVVELRRYEIKFGERERFVCYFDAHVPEVFEQIGFIGFGQFQEWRNFNGFAWLRGFPSYDARSDMNTDFYRGLVWKEVGAALELPVSSTSTTCCSCVRWLRDAVWRCCPCWTR